MICRQPDKSLCHFKIFKNDLPQWNTAFTSRFSDKNKSGFRFRAYKSDTASEHGTRHNSSSGSVQSPPTPLPKALPSSPLRCAYSVPTNENQLNVHQLILMQTDQVSKKSTAKNQILKFNLSQTKGGMICNFHSLSLLD